MHVDAPHYRFKLIGGFGNSVRTGHLKLTSCKVSPLPSTALESEKLLQHDLGAAASPVSARQLFVAKEPHWNFQSMQ